VIVAAQSPKHLYSSCHRALKHCTLVTGAPSKPDTVKLPSPAVIEISAQSGPVVMIGVPSHPQPSAVTTSFSVSALASSQAVPGVAGTLASLSSQSSEAGTPSPSASVGPVVTMVPAQSQPLARITSFSVSAFPSSQVVPGVAGTLASLSSQSSEAITPSPSASTG